MIKPVHFTRHHLLFGELTREEREKFLKLATLLRRGKLEKMPVLPKRRPQILVVMTFPDGSAHALSLSTWEEVGIVQNTSLFALASEVSWYAMADLS